MKSCIGVITIRALIDQSGSLPWAIDRRSASRNQASSTTSLDDERMLPLLLTLAAGREGAGMIWSACFGRDLLEEAEEGPIRVSYCAFNLAIKLLGDTTWNGRRMRNHRNFILLVERLGITSCNCATFNLLLFTTNCVSCTRVYFRRFNTLDTLPWIPIPISTTSSNPSCSDRLPSFKFPTSNYSQMRWCFKLLLRQLIISSINQRSMMPRSSVLRDQAVHKNQLPVQVYFVCEEYWKMAGSISVLENATRWAWICSRAWYIQV